MQLRLTPYRMQRIIEAGRQKTLREAKTQETTIETKIPSLIYVTNKKRSYNNAVNIPTDNVSDLEDASIGSDVSDYDLEILRQEMKEMFDEFLANQQKSLERQDKLNEMMMNVIEALTKNVNPLKTLAIKERPAKKRRRTR